LHTGIASSVVGQIRMTQKNVDSVGDLGGACDFEGNNEESFSCSCKPQNIVEGRYSRSFNNKQLETFKRASWIGKGILHR